MKTKPRNKTSGWIILTTLLCALAFPAFAVGPHATGGNQYRADTGVAIAAAGTIPTGVGVYFEANVTSDEGRTIRMEVELRSSKTAFTGTANYFSSYVSGGTRARTTTATGLAAGNWYWRYRVVDSAGVASNWVLEGSPDFIVQSSSTVPTVQTVAAAGTTTTSATINGTITSDGGSSIIDRRFDWGTTSGNLNQAVFAASITVSGNNFSATLTGLSPGTTYYFRAWARNGSTADVGYGAGWNIGSILPFTTSASCSYSISPSSASPGASSGSGSFGMTAGGGCSWSASTAYSWIHTTSSGSGNGTVSYAYDANTSTSSRSGTITAGGQTFTITQSGTSCSYSISPSSASPSANSGSGSFSMTAGSGCSWSASTAYSWIHTTSSGSGNGTVSYTYDANTSTSSRSGTITAGGQTFNMTQAGSTTASKVFGVDVSACQQTAIDWNQVSQSTVNNGGQLYPIAFAYIRASKGAADVDNCQFKDPHFASWAASASSRGITVGAYHVAGVINPAGGTFSPQAEAAFFVSVAGNYIQSGNLRPAFDIEDHSCGNPRSIGWSTLATWVDQWMQEVHRLTGVWPVIYCSEPYKSGLGTYLASTYDLWVASVLSPPNPDATPNSSPWTASLLYQYSWNGVVGGITGNATCAGNSSSYVDMNVFQGTLQSFQSQVVIGACSYSISPNSASPGASTGSGSFSMTAGSGCSWSASTAYTWIHTTSSGSGNGTVSYTYDSNSSTSSRSGTITAGGQTFTITQAGTISTPAITSPSPGSTLSSSSATFQWSSGTGVTEYFFYVGTTLGGNEIYGLSQGLNQSVTVNNLPVNGSTLYVRLWWQIAGSWYTADYTYTAATICSYSLSPSSASPGASSGSGSFSMTAGSGCSWSASTAYSWIHTTSSGSDNGTVSYTYDANTSTSSRSGTITAGGQTFTLTQAGISCSYFISPSSASPSASSGSGSFSMTAGSGCSWSASTAYSWIHTTSSGSGNGTISYTYDANTSTSTRTGTMTIAGQTFTVNQAGSNPTPANDQCSGAIALVGGVSATLNTANATSTGDPTTGCGQLGKGVWYSFTPNSSGTVTISTCGSDFDTAVSVYSGTCGLLTALSGGCNDDNGPSCTGTQASISFSSVAGSTYWILVGGFSGASGNLQVVVTSGACTYSISPTSTSPTSSGGTGSVSVTAGTGCNWTANSAASWITITAGSSDSGNGAVNYSVAANTSTSVRMTTMTIAGQTFTVNQAGVPSFVPTKASYNGLFYQTLGVTHESSGLLSVATTARGTFSGNLRLGGKNYSFSGRLAADGTATVSITRKSMSTIIVTLQMDWSGEMLTGMVSDGTWQAELFANRSVFDSKTNPAPNRGKYTLVIPGTENSSTMPGGDGFGTITIDASRNITFVGKLGDGTMVSQSVPLSSQWHWPFYISLYSTKGSILGWLTFADELNSDINGHVNWIKLPQTSAKFYPSGFNMPSEVIGSAFAQPFAGTRVLNFTQGQVWLAGGNLPFDFGHQILLGTNNRITNLTDSKSTLSLTVSSGLFQGSIMDPSTRRKISIKGVVLQKRNVGFGYFLGSDQSGSVYFGP